MANLEESNSQIIQVKMALKGETKEMFEQLKKHYNLGYNSELIRLLIKKVYDLEFSD